MTTIVICNKLPSNNSHNNNKIITIKISGRLRWDSSILRVILVATTITKIRILIIRKIILVLIFNSRVIIIIRRSFKSRKNWIKWRNRGNIGKS